MADIKFSELQKATTSKDSDEIAILQDGVNKMIASPILESKIINKTVSRVIEQGGASLNVINLKGVVPTYADLSTITPTPELNDAYQVEADGLVYVYTDTGFQADGEGVKVQPDVSGVVEQGNTNAVSGGEVYSNVLKNNFLNEKQGYAQYNQIKNINKNIISIKSLPYNGYLVLNTLSVTSTSFGVSISLLTEKNQTVPILNDYRVATGSTTFADVTTVGIVTLRLNPFNNNGFWIELTVNVSELWKNYAVFNSRPDTSWLNAGFLPEKIDIIHSSGILNVDNSVVVAEKNKTSIIDRIVRNINAYDNVLLSDYLIISQFLYSETNKTYHFYISKKNNPTDIASASTPNLVARVNVLFNKGKHVVNIVDNATQSIILGEMEVDLDLLPTVLPYISYADNPTYLTRGIKQNKINDVFSKRAVSSGGITISEYPSVFDAFQDNKSKRIIIGNKELVSENLPLASKLDYITKENKEIPNLTIVDTKSWKYNTYTLKLRDYHNGYYYLQSDYNIVRTTDLNTSTTTWEMIASTSNLGISVYPFNNIRIVNDELVISAKQGSDFVFFWINLETKTPRPITVEGVTANYWITPTNGSMILPFSISTYGNIYVMALYDIGTTGVSRGNAQKVFLSQDRGQTFTMIFDYDTSNVINWASANKQKASFHIHGATYDPYWRRIWFVSGDNNTHLDNTSVFWTDDFGLTWNWRRLAEKESPTGARQIMNLIPFQDHLIGLSDSPDVGMCRINRNSKSNFTVENAVTYGARELYAWGRNYVWHKDVLYMTFGYQAGATSAGGFLLSTIDGYDYKKVWEDSGAGVQSDWTMWVVSDGKYLYMNLDNANGNTLVFDV